MAWFDFLKRKPKPARPAPGRFPPEHFSCPGPNTGGKLYTPEDFPCPDPNPGWKQYTPEHFPCPDPNPGGKQHWGAYDAWLDPKPKGDEIAFAVVVPKGSSDESELRAIGVQLLCWQSAHDFVRRIIGLDQLVRGEFPETPADLLWLSSPPFTERVALVYVAPAANDEDTGASLNQALDGLSIATVLSPAYYTLINR
jgi:hypothetical protein